MPERRLATEEFFENAILPKIHDAFISALVLDELSRTRDAGLRHKFIDAVTRYGLDLLPPDDSEVGRLARVYMDGGILPSKKPEDAFHVTYATVFEMDALVTWNFRHIAKVRTAALVAGVNRIEGYAKPLLLLTPLEVLEP